MWRGADCCGASGRSRNASAAVNVASRLSDGRPRGWMSRGNRGITQAAVTTCQTSMIRSIRAHVRGAAGRCASSSGDTKVRRRFRAPDAQRRIPRLLSGFSFTVSVLNVALVARTRTQLMRSKTNGGRKDC